MEGERGYKPPMTEGDFHHRAPRRNSHVSKAIDDVRQEEAGYYDEDITLRGIFKEISPRAKALLAATAIAVFGGIHWFSNWQLDHMKPVKPTPVIDLNDPSIPGYNEIYNPANTSTTTVVSAPPGKTPITTTIPKK